VERNRARLSGRVWAIACAAFALLTSAGCLPTVRTRIIKPASAVRGSVGFGVTSRVYQGVGVSSSESVVGIAAGSDPKEALGDYVWRVRDGLLEYCAWRSGEPTDCRFAVELNATSLPTFVEPANLGGYKATLTITRENSTFVANAARQPPISLPHAPSRALWVRTVGLGLSAVLRCVPEPDGPICRPLSIGAGLAIHRILSIDVVRGADGKTSEVLWLAGGQIVTGLPAFLGGGIGLINDTAIVRCEVQEGKSEAECKPARME